VCGGALVIISTYLLFLFTLWVGSHLFLFMFAFFWSPKEGRGVAYVQSSIQWALVLPGLPLFCLIRVPSLVAARFPDDRVTADESPVPPIPPPFPGGPLMLFEKYGYLFCLVCALFFAHKVPIFLCLLPSYPPQGRFNTLQLGQCGFPTLWLCQAQPHFGPPALLAPPNSQCSCPMEISIELNASSCGSVNPRLVLHSPAEVHDSRADTGFLFFTPCVLPSPCLSPRD